MKDDEGTPAASGDLLIAAAPAAVAMVKVKAKAKAKAKAASVEPAAASRVGAAALAPASAMDAAALAMAATEIESVEAAEVVQAHTCYHCRACAPTNHAATDRDPTATLLSPQVQVELKKGETIMTDASLHLPAAFLHEAFSNRSGVPPDHFELYYRGKRLEGEAALSSWGVRKNATIEVKMRGRGGMDDRKVVSRWERIGNVWKKIEERTPEAAAQGHSMSGIGDNLPSKRLEGEAALGSWGVEKDATIEVKMRGRGGMNTADGKQVGEPSSPSKVHAEQKLREAQGAGVKDVKAGKEALPAPRKASDVIELHGGLTLKQPQASIAYPPYTPCPQKLL